MERGDVSVYFTIDFFCNDDNMWLIGMEITFELEKISDREQRLKVFDKNSVYLPTKKIGKNNPKAAEIEADNTARQGQIITT